MRGEVMIFSYVNLPDGYIWLTDTLGEVPEDIRESLETAAQKSFNSRISSEISGQMGGAFLRAIVIYDEAGRDDADRKGLVFIVGAHGTTAEILDDERMLKSAAAALMALRGELIVRETGRETARILFRSALALFAGQLRPAESRAQEVEVVEERAPKARKGVSSGRRLFLVQLGQMLCLAALVAMAAYMLLSGTQKKAPEPVTRSPAQQR